MNRKDPETIVERLLANKVRAEYEPENSRIIIDHYKYGLIDYYYKGNKIKIRKSNTWIELGLLWIKENIIINEIQLYTKKEVESLIFNYCKDYIIETSSIKEENLKMNIEMYLNIHQ